MPGGAIMPGIGIPIWLYIPATMNVRPLLTPYASNLSTKSITSVETCGSKMDKDKQECRVKSRAYLGDPYPAGTVA